MAKILFLLTLLVLGCHNNQGERKAVSDTLFVSQDGLSGGAAQQQVFLRDTLPVRIVVASARTPETVMATETPMPRRRVRQQPASSAEPVQQAPAALTKANIAYAHPDSATVGEPFDLELSVSRTIGMDSLLGSLPESYGTRRSVGSVDVSDRIEVKLVADTSIFSVTAINPDVQSTQATSIARWKWSVRPLRSGSQTLHLSVRALVPGGDAMTWNAVDNYDAKVLVTVKEGSWLSAFLSENWKWLASTILLPLVVFLWGNRKSATKKRRR